MAETSGAGTRSQSQAADDASDKSSVTVDRELPGDALGRSLVDVLKQHGKPVMSQVREMAKLAFSKGKISPAEYFELRLYDDSLSWDQKTEFVGLKAAQRYWKICNYDHGWRGLVWDKSAVYALLKGYGFQVPETLAVLHQARSFNGIETLRTADDLCRFLVECDSYPLFCKPNNSLQSLGSIALSGVGRDRMVLRTGDGREVAVTEFAAIVSRYADQGYLVQKQLRPAPALRDTIGDAVSTVRVMTINGAQGPKVFRLLWKVPGAGNYADNYWRQGNMLAQVDYDTGRVLRLITGTGTGQRILDALPQSGTSANDLSVPGWSGILDLAKAAADALPRLRLIGWDIAPTDAGPVIIEANDTPDFALPQYADRRGMHDAEFEAFTQECVEQRKIDAATFRRLLKEGIQKDARRLRRQSKLTEF